MSFFSEIYFSTLLGRPVYTRDEKYYGEFRDFIVKREQDTYVVTKVRVRDIHGKRVIIAWPDVFSIEATPPSIRLKKNSDQIVPLDYGDEELRLKRDMLDQQIIDTNENRVVRVNDIKIVSVGTELFVVAADISFLGLLRRVGFEGIALVIAQLLRSKFPTNLIPSKYIDPFPARVRHDIKLNVGQDEIKKMHPADIADIVENLDSFERMKILQALPEKTAAASLKELDREVRQTLVRQIKDEELSRLLEKMAPDAATDIVAELPRRRMHRVLEIMKSTEADEIKALLKFKEGTAGSIMTTEFVAVPGNITGHEALERLRKVHEHAEHIYYLYIIDENERLKGVVSLRELIFMDPQKMLIEMVKRRPHAVKIDDSVEKVAGQFIKYNVIAMPVVDIKRHIVGVITVDDVLEEMREEEEM